MHDLFEVGYVDKGIFQPTYLTDFYINGFNTTERNGALAEKHPEKLITNGAWDPRDGEAGLDALEALHERWNLKGVKLYTAEWKGDSKAGSSPTPGRTGTWRSARPWASGTSTCTRARPSTR